MTKGTIPTYLDFELRIGTGGSNYYPVTVIHSPAGEASGEFHWPFGETPIKTVTSNGQASISRALRAKSGAKCLEIMTVGGKLFRALFTDSLRSTLDLSLAEAQRQEKGLRIKLRMEPPELSGLPWEFLYDERMNRFFCLFSRTPLVRYVEMLQPIRPLAVHPPLNLLVIISAPTNYPPLDVAREKEKITTALQTKITQGQISLPDTFSEAPKSVTQRAQRRHRDVENWII